MAEDDHKQGASRLNGGAQAGVGGDDQGEGMPLALGGGGKGGSGKTARGDENRPNGPDASRH